MMREDDAAAPSVAPLPLTGRRVLIGVTGAIAAAALPPGLALARLAMGLDRPRFILTHGGAQLVTPKALAATSGGEVFSQASDHSGDSRVLHVELAEWADVVVVMPATANLLSRLAAGAADDLLTSVLLATSAPVIVAPSMNHVMWTKPSVQRNVKQLIDDGIHIIEPAPSFKASDGTFAGEAMPPVAAVLNTVADILDSLRSDG